MKIHNFLGVANTAQQAYFKEGVEALYPSLDNVLRIAILPAYDPMDPSATGHLPSVVGNEESDFYTMVRAAKFVGHGNRRAKTAFLSPRTFDLSADDPYEAFYDYCSRSDRWSYLTKDKRGRKLSGEVEGAPFPRMKNFIAMNVMDVSAGSRGGVFVAEFSESVAKNLIYSTRKDGARVNGIAFERNSSGQLIFGDITDPKGALVIEIAFSGKAYLARPAQNHDGSAMRIEIPETLLQHRRHMEEPASFLVHPGSGQDIVDKLAGMLRGYKDPSGRDEIEALKEAMKFAFGGKYIVDEEAEDKRPSDPFGDAATTVMAKPEEKAEEVSASVERGVESERYVPVNPAPAPKAKAPKAKSKAADKPKAPAIAAEPAPGEDIDPSDIANLRAMLRGGKK